MARRLVSSLGMSAESALSFLQLAARDRGAMVGVRHLIPAVASALLQHFGTFREAWRRAGLRMPPRNSRYFGWTRATVIAELKALDALGVRLTANDLRAVYGRIVAAAIDQFATFDGAREAAGLARPHRRTGPKPRRWTRRSILAAIRREHAAGRPLSHAKAPPGLERAARKAFGTWRNAIDAAGVRYQDVSLHRRWSDDDIVRTLRDLAKTEPDLTANRFHTRHRSLASIVRRRFGSITEAFARAGLEDWPRRVVTRPLVPWTGST